MVKLTVLQTVSIQGPNRSPEESHKIQLAIQFNKYCLKLFNIKNVILSNHLKNKYSGHFGPGAESSYYHRQLSYIYI